MIELKQLAAELEERLNNGLTGGIEYKLFTDTGAFKKAYRVKNAATTVINGIYSNTASDISNVYTDDGGYIVATMTNEAVIVVPCQDDEEDVVQVIHNADGTTTSELLEIGNVTFLAQIRKRLDNIAAQTLNFSLTDGAGKEYDISAVFSIADGGMREQLPELGDCFTYSLVCAYNIIENGDNSRKWKLYIDGEAVPYSSMSIQRQTTNETTVYANRGRSTSTLTVADTFACAVEFPSILKGVNSVIRDFLLNGSNGYAHVAKIVAGNSTVYKLIVLSDSTATASGVLNVGEKLQINETKEEYGLIAFSSKYKIYRALKNNSLYVSSEGNFEYFVYCRNGVSEIRVKASTSAGFAFKDIKQGDIFIFGTGASVEQMDSDTEQWEKIQ